MTEGYDGFEGRSPRDLTASNPVESILVLLSFSMTGGYDGFEGQSPRDLTGSNPDWNSFTGIRIAIEKLIRINQTLI